MEISLLSLALDLIEVRDIFLRFLRLKNFPFDSFVNLILMFRDLIISLLPFLDGCFQQLVKFTLSGSAFFTNLA